MAGALARLAEGPLGAGGLLLEDVARVGVTAADLALGGQLEALLRARMGLHLRHGGRRRIAKVAFCGPAPQGPPRVALPWALVAKASREGEPPARGLGANQSDSASES